MVPENLTPEVEMAVGLHKGGRGIPPAQDTVAPYTQVLGVDIKLACSLGKAVVSAHVVELLKLGGHSSS